MLLSVLLDFDMQVVLRVQSKAEARRKVEKLRKLYWLDIKMMGMKAIVEKFS